MWRALTLASARERAILESGATGAPHRAPRIVNVEADIHDQVRQDIDRAPKQPGCYLFRGPAKTGQPGKVLYVGKAKVLRHRLKSYLRPEADGRLRIPYMVREAVSVEMVITATEKEALVLENNLIKVHRPTYNISLKDDKTYVSVRLDMRHPYPRPTIVHKYKKDGATYIGPFASSFKLRQTLEALKRDFPLRRCSDHILRNRTRPCVYHDIGLCCAPCVPGKVPQGAYRDMVDRLVNVLQGRDARPIAQIEQRMQDAASASDFELAALLRDQLFALRQTVESQNVQIGGRKTVNRDVVGLHREGEHAQIHVLIYRDDKLLGSTSHQFRSSLPDDELIEQFVQRYYEGDRAIPPEVLLPITIDDEESLGAYIADKAGYWVEVRTPQRGDKLALVSLANLNARHAMRDIESKQEQTEGILNRLREAIGLENIPRRMECYDISHLQGDEIVGSGVCFADGVPDKSQYRRYKLKEVTSNDDFASMEEVLRRRVRRGLEEADFPDLIVIDGGTAQLDRVQKVFDELNVVGVDLIGLAKSRDKSAPAWVSNYKSARNAKTTDERVFLPGRVEPITLDQKSQELFLLMRLRDEAHRFAITYNRERRKNTALKSGLDAIPGVGPKRKRALIKRFGSPAQIRRASAEELTQIEGINDALAEKILNALREERGESDAAT